ncbi:MAG TPA: DUF4350 domain-containing protein [Gemmatimonadaceae bacterium]|nr:DUF4350 domain-containing protein [Gemmatimonadaceae bacterium]
MRQRWLSIIAGLVVVLLLAFGLLLYGHNQIADDSYDVSVAKPFNTQSHPTVCIDEAHHNFATAEGRYRPFARFLTNDGYRVVSTTTEFTMRSLAKCRVLVIANALGATLPVFPSASKSPFDSSEISDVLDWVRNGGSLLLVADHHPAGGASAALARAFGVDMSGGRTYDDPHSDWSSGSPSWLIFGRDTGAKILDHWVTLGRDSSEMVRRIETFTGQSLKGPPGSVGFLQLAASAVDRLPSGATRSATGRAQGVSLAFGGGRVVVLGEAAMISAQVTGVNRRRKFGMNWPNNDNRQLVLNIAHWLSSDVGRPLIQS